MPRDFLKDAKDGYDVVVIGSGLAGLTAANMLGPGRAQRAAARAALQARRHGHVVQAAAAGTSSISRCTAFPYGMIKSCRRYWTQEIADSIVQLKHIRFDNPMFSLTTTFNRDDFTRLLIERFQSRPGRRCTAFFDTARGMNFYDDQSMTTRELFEKFFPGREDVIRLLMEPITYANGSTLEDPAISYGIVFSNFMSKGVFTFEGGTDRLIGLMEAELRKSGVDIRIKCDVDEDRLPAAAACAASRSTAGRFARGAVDVERQPQRHDLQPGRRGVFRPRRSSTTPGPCGSTIPARRSTWPSSRTSGSTNRRATCCSARTAPLFRTELLLSRDITSRTYSFYYPRTRPEGRPRCLIVSSTNANYDDWASLTRGRVRGEQAATWSKRRSTRSTSTCRTSASGSTTSKRRRRVTFEHYTQARQRRELRHEVRRPGRQPGAAAADRRPVPRRQRRHHHVAAGWGR